MINVAPISRCISNSRSITPAASARQDALEPTTRGVLAASLVLSYGLMAGFLASEVELPRRLGAAPIILLAFTSWILFGSIVLVLLPKAYGLPSLALLPVFLLLAAGGVDNHEVRQLPPEAGARRTFRSASSRTPTGACSSTATPRDQATAATSASKTSSSPAAT